MDPSSQLSPSIRVREDAARPQVSRGCGVLFFAIMIVVAAAWGSGLGAFVFLLEQAQSKIEALESFRPKIGSRIYAQQGDMLGEYTLAAQDLVNLSEIPLNLQKAFLASEARTMSRLVSSRLCRPKMVNVELSPTPTLTRA